MDRKDENVSEAVPKYRHAEKLSTTPGDGKRYEIIDGIPYEMVDGDYREIIDGVIYALASPSTRHQRVHRKLFMKIGNFLEGKPCEVFAAPLDVFLDADDEKKADDEKNATVQPDIFVVCEADLRSTAEITDKGCKGAPDFIIEILSPSNARHDLLVKLQLYEKYGVREYWIVNPEINTVTVYILENGQFRIINSYAGNDVVPVHILEGCEIKLAEVFAG